MAKEAVVVNDNLLLICGYSAGGKSASLRNLKDHKGVMYLNCEAGKKLPFPNKFKALTITDPLDVYQAFDEAENMQGIHTIVVDSATFLMDMFETVHVLTASDTQEAWGKFQQYFKKLMQKYVAKSTKNVIFTAHVHTEVIKQELVTAVPVKGALKKNGLEAYFSTIIYAKKLDIDDLEEYKNGLLTASLEEEALGIKYVFQTRLTKDTVHERIRSNMGMWEIEETFIDNDAQLVLDRLHKYYA